MFAGKQEEEKLLRLKVFQLFRETCDWMKLKNNLLFYIFVCFQMFFCVVVVFFFCKLFVQKQKFVLLF